MKRAFLYTVLLGMLLFSKLSAQNIRYQGNIKGGFALTGNTFRYNLIATDFLNTDIAAGVARSSAADLVLPPGSTIIKAFLYVEGMTATPITEIKFKVPGAPFQVFNTTSAGFIGNPNSAASYQQFIIDVTKVIPADGYVTTLISGGNPSGAGRYAVADFDPGTATNFGYGWSLFVVYTNPAAQYRSVTIADNCSYLSVSTPVSLTINNVVVPVSGPVKAVAALTGSYGDYGSSWADRITLGVVGGPETHLADPFTGSTSDILNSSIAFHAGNNVSADGGPAMSGNFTARNPYFFTCPNDPAIHNWSSFYFDADILDASGILPNSTVPIDVVLKQTLNSADATGSGTYALSVDIAAAILSKSISPSFILPGAVATYTFTIANNQPGAINLNDIAFTDNLPAALVIANPASVVISGTTATVAALPGGNTINVSDISLVTGQTATISVNVTNVAGQLNPSCAANPAAFTNGFNNISDVSSNLVNNVSDQCLVVNPTLPPAGVLPVTYCQFDIAVPLSATGLNLLWYTTAAGGTGTGVPPVPATSVPGVTTWYVSQTIDGVESPRVPLVVTVMAPTLPLFDSMIVCRGSKPQPLPGTSVNGITGTWNPGVANTAVTATYTFTPDAGQCAVPVTLPVLVKPVSELSWMLDASVLLSDDTICQGETVTFSSTSRVLHQPASCLWYFGDGGFSNNNIAAHNYPLPGLYQVTFVVSDTVSCRDTAYRTVTVDSMPFLELSLAPDTLCAGESVAFTAAYTKQGNDRLSWDFGDHTYIDNINPTQHAYEERGLYPVKVTAEYRACRDLSREDRVNVYPLPDVYIGPDTSICPNSPPMVLTNLQQGDAGDRYRWNTGDTTHALKVTHDGIYSLLVAGRNGCTTRDELIVRKNCYMDIPNSFTPDGDGINDYFFPRQLLASGITSFSMVVFNRWGEVIFKTNLAEGSGWDGRFNDKEQPVGVYLYQLHVTFQNGQVEYYDGNITLLR